MYLFDSDMPFAGYVSLVRNVSLSWRNVPSIVKWDTHPWYTTVSGGWWVVGGESEMAEKTLGMTVNLSTVGQPRDPQFALTTPCFQAAYCPI